MEGIEFTKDFLESVQICHTKKSLRFIQGPSTPLDLVHCISKYRDTRYS